MQSHALSTGAGCIVLIALADHNFVLSAAYFFIRLLGNAVESGSGSAIVRQAHQGRYLFHP